MDIPKIYELNQEAYQNPLDVRWLQMPTAGNYLKHLARFPNIEWLDCVADSQTTEWPLLAQLPHLHTLNIRFFAVTVPEVFFEMRGLKTLSVSGSFYFLIDKIHQLQDLQHFSITNTSPVADGAIQWLEKAKQSGEEYEYPVFPQSVFQIRNLESLRINMPYLQFLPNDAFLNFDKIREISLTYNKINPNVIENIFSRKTLETLSLDLQHHTQKAVPLTELPASVGQLEHLNDLDLARHGLRSLPETFNRLVNLERLNLSGNRFKTFPFEVSNFKKLRKLDLSYNKIDALPEGLIYLENIETLNLRGNPIAKHPVYRKGEPAVAFLKKIQGLSPAAKKAAWAVFADEKDTVKETVLDLLLHALTVDLQLFQRAVHNLLNQRLKNPFEQTDAIEQPVLWLVGRKFFGLTKAELMERLISQEITVKNDFSTEVTHIVLGEVVAKSSVSKITGALIPLATADHLKLFLERLENPYLKQADEPLADNLLRLLNSAEESNVKLALQMLETGGIPDDLLYRVFCLCFYKIWGEYNLAPDLRRTFEKTGPPHMVRLTKQLWQKESEKLSAALLQQDSLDKKRLFDAAFYFFEPAIGIRLSQHDRQPPTEEETRLSWWMRFFKSLVIEISKTDSELTDYVFELCKQRKVFEAMLEQRQVLFTWLEAKGKIQEHVAELLIENRTLDVRQLWFNPLWLPLSMPIEIILMDTYTFRYTYKRTIQHYGSIQHLKKIRLEEAKFGHDSIDEALGLWQKYAPHIEIFPVDSPKLKLPF
ncbi:MAG: leucine-rich repeat domain-containing protein [Cytophagales bacterium]|jgi:hypothetical protein|nr:leucine-rich repeat domain-containing protein [Cytophagales bacterium]